MSESLSGLLTRRRVLQLGLASALAAAGATAACSGGTPLKVALQSWGGFQFMRLAERRGWLGDARVALVDVESSEEATAGLRDGRFDAATLTLDEVVRLRGSGVDVQVALVCDVSAGADVLLAKPELRSLADLRGQRIGVEATALGALVFSEVLHAAGLRRDDVAVVPIEEDHFVAWQRRQDLDAVLTYGTSAELLRALGLRPLIDSRDLRTVIFDVLAVRRNLGSGERRAIEALVAGHFRGVELWQRNRIDAAYELALLLDTPAENVNNLFKGIDLPDVTYNRHALSPPATELAETARDVGTVLVKAGMLPAEPALAQLFTADYLPRAT